MAGNLRKRFDAVLPQDQLRVAKVVAHNSDGTSTVEDPSGTWTARVMRQTVPVGSMAFVQSGRIIEAAPNLTYTEVQLPPYPVAAPPQPGLDFSNSDNSQYIGSIL